MPQAGDPLQLHLFEQVADGLHSLLPGHRLGPWHQRNHRWGIKVWFGDAAPPNRVHYEAQVVGARLVPGATAVGLEVGFHAELADRAENQAIIDRLAAVEDRWREALGDDAVAGPFLGGKTRGWTRLSETWPDPDLGDPDLPFELAARLTDYVVALQPLLAGVSARG